ncbi:VOC family protein [Vannielia litorea]|uniref:VOC family protein n=1 Tax=Vannielia litorea TaxID=1217970 RepID=UPI001C98C5D7|nr:VOC family protein [Vannielia litorea]MBY6154156.1 VOC family protein [Vannielia litorea]
MSLNHGKVWWSELMTHDAAAARAFYEQTCGWRFETVRMSEGDYHVAHVHGAAVAGIMDLPGSMAGVPPHWFTYLAVDDVDASVAAIGDLGGEVVRPPFDVPEAGRIAIVKDPSGATVGLMTPVEARIGAVKGEPDGDPPLEDVPL